MDNVIAALYCSSKSRNYVPGFSFALKEFNSLLDLKQELLLEKRIELIYYFYNLLHLKVEIEPFLVQGISNTLVRLLKKSQLFKSVDLVLDWRILYSQLENVYLVKSSHAPLPGTLKHYSNLIKLTIVARMYFNTGEITDIFSEFLSGINLNGLKDTRNSVLLVLLGLFIPNSNSLNSSEKKILHQKVWVELFFQIWKNIVQDSSFDGLVLEIYANLVSENVLDSRKFGFSRELVDFIVYKGQAAMGLPIGNVQQASWHQSLKQELTGWIGSRLHNLARFLVWTWFPNDRFGLGSQNHLETLLQAVEGYYHPSNYGKWSLGLARFLQSLSSQFLKRLRLEKSLECQTDVENRLSVQDSEKFVVLLRPLALMSMFSKDNSCIVATHATLKNLAWIAPDLILPPLLDRIYPALESLTESHRTLSCIGALCSVSRPLFTFSHFPKGLNHLIPILSLTLPGIDMNDPSKASATLLFIILLLHTVPLVECSNSQTTASVDEEVFRLNTIGLQDWVLHFLSRIFSLFENLPEGHESSSNNRQTSETSLIEMVMWSCEMIFCQASSEIQEACMAKIINFVSKNVIPSATKAISFLCGSVHGPEPGKRLAAFVPLCKKNMMLELGGGASTFVGGSHLASNPNPFGFARMSDAPFHYFQSILISCVNTSGEALINYSDDFMEILDKTYQHCVSRRGYKWAAKLLRTLCFSLGCTYIKETRSCPSNIWNSTEFKTHAFRYYGKTYTPDELSIDWHVPNNAEVECAIRILEEFAERTLNDISKVVDPLSSGFSNDLCRWLCWLKSIILSINAMLEPEQSVFEPPLDDIFQEPHERCPIQNMYAVSKDHPCFTRLLKLREGVGAELARISKLLLCGYGEDSIEPVRSLIKNILLFMTYRGTDNGRYDGFSRLLTFLKSMIKSEEDHKNLPRTYAVKRMFLLHLSRLKYNSAKAKYEPIYKDLVDAIFNFTISKYSQIRRASLPCLSRILRCFSAYKYDLFPKYLTILSAAASTEKDDDVIDGACQVLRSSSFLGMTLRHWPFAHQLLITLVKAEKNIERPKSLEILRKLFFDYILQFSGIPFTYPTAGLDSVYGALPNGESEFKRMEEVSLKRSQIARNSYSDLLKNMVQLLKESNLHWRFSGMALNFLGLILCDQQPVPAELTTYVAETILNEHPALRKSSITLAIRILVVQKKRATLQGTNKIEKLKLSINLDADSAQKFQKSFTNWIKQDNMFADIPYYIDYGCSFGWMCFPNTFRAYAVDGEDCPIWDESSADSEHILKAMVNRGEFWKTFLSFMSQESVSEFGESFNVTSFLFYKRIFSRFGPTPLEIALEYVNSYVLAVEDKSKQRAAAEFLAGVIRGSKHWSIKSRDKMWLKIVPLIKTGIQFSTTDSARYWGEFVSFSCGKLDPRRIRPLIDLIFSNVFEPDSESFFTESKKLAFVNEVFLTFSWRIHPMIMEYLDLYHRHLDNPYKSIRDTLGKLMSNLIKLEWHPSLKAIDEVFTNPSLLIPQENLEIKQIMLNIAAELEKSRLENNVAKYQNTAKSVLAYAIESLQSYQNASASYLLICIPEIFLMQDSSDTDLQTLAKHVFQVSFPMFPHSPSGISKIIKVYLQYLKNTKSNGDAISWHRRKRILPALQIIYFQNLHVLKRELQEEVLDYVRDLLFDSQVEIRQLSATTLSGLVRCSRRDVIMKIRESSTMFLMSGKLPRNSKEIASDLLLKCHGSLLALGALILAFPYEIMDWMPETLVTLSRFVSYVSPIGPEVKKIFAEFRRTHQDNWREDKTKFSEDQLYELSDLLISPSYYV